MSHASRRPNREELKARRKERKRAQKALEQQMEQEGLPRTSHATISNGKSRYQSMAEEGVARTEAAWELYPPTDYLLAYWSGRYFGFIPETL